MGKKKKYGNKQTLTRRANTYGGLSATEKLMQLVHDEENVASTFRNLYIEITEPTLNRDGSFDFHGMTPEDAEAWCEKNLATKMKMARSSLLVLVTGRGNHSEKPGVSPLRNAVVKGLKEAGFYFEPISSGGAYRVTNKNVSSKALTPSQRRRSETTDQLKTSGNSSAIFPLSKKVTEVLSYADALKNNGAKLKG